MARPKENVSAQGRCAGTDPDPTCIAFKRAEIKSLDQLEESEICRRYAEVY